jgi:hypothetical protein
MDFKIKIDLSPQELLLDTSQIKPPKDKKKRKKVQTEGAPGVTENPKKKIARKEGTGNERSAKKKSNQNSEKKVKEKLDISGVKLNTNSLISLTLPNLDNLKGDQAQKLSMIVKKKPRHWERRWVLIPNVFEFSKEIWLKRWVLVDGDEDIVDNDVRVLVNHIELSPAIL